MIQTSKLISTSLFSVVKTELLIMYRKRYTYIFLLISLCYAFLSLPPRRFEIHEFLWQRFHYEYSPNFAGLSASILFSINFSLFGFYLLKDCIRREQLNSFGSVIGSTLLIYRVYIYGKFIAAHLYLLIFLITLYFGSLFMYFVTGKKAFNVWQHAKPFIIFGYPTTIATASVSILISSLKWIPQKTINVIYLIAHFVLQLQILSTMLNSSNALIFALLDYTGLATLYLSYEKIGIAFEGMSIGYFGYGMVNQENPLITIPLRDFQISMELLVARFFLIFISLLLVYVSLKCFRVGSGNEKYFNFNFQIFPNLHFFRIRGNARQIPTFFSIICAEILLIYRLNRLAFIMATLVSLYSLTLPLSYAHLFVTPILFLFGIIIFSDCSLRDYRSSTSEIRYTLPLTEHQIFHKYIASILISPALILIPFFRFFLIGDFATSTGIMIGMVWVITLSITGSTLTGTEKFSLSLLTLYILISLLADRIDSVFIDFGTWRGYSHEERWKIILCSFFLISFGSLIGKHRRVGLNLFRWGSNATI